MKKILNIAIMMCFSGMLLSWTVSSLQWNTISSATFSAKLVKINTRMEKMMNYEVTITDASYANYTTSVYHQKSTGFFKRSEEKFHEVMLGIHTIQNGKCRIVVDSANKTIIVADPVKVMNTAFSAAAYDSLLRLCTRIQQAVSGDKTYYKVSFKDGLPYTAYEIVLKNNLPQEVILYYSKKVNENNVVAQPRMEITFSSWKVNDNVKESAFDINRFIIKKGNNYKLQSAYAQKYKLLDERVMTRD